MTRHTLCRVIFLGEAVEPRHPLENAGRRSYTSCRMLKSSAPGNVPPSRPAQQLVSIYELTNTTRREFLVWVGEDGQNPSGIVPETMRPAQWDAADHVIINTIESGLKREEALAFRDGYVKNISQMPGWNVRVIGPES